MPQSIKPNRFGEKYHGKVPVSIVTDPQLCPGQLKNGGYFLFAFKLGFKCFFSCYLVTCAA